MMGILRVGATLGVDELLVLSKIENARIIIGNEIQCGLRDSRQLRRVSPDRLLNMGLAAAQMQDYSKVIVSGKPETANGIFGSKRTRADERIFLIRDSQPEHIYPKLESLNTDLIDLIQVTNPRAEQVVNRFFHQTQLPIEKAYFQVDNDAGRSAETDAEVTAERSLNWFGSVESGSGILDFLRIASLVDGPVNINWMTVPSPDEFSRVMSTASFFGLVERLRMHKVHTLEDLISEVESNRVSACWFYTARDYSDFTGVEAVALTGARIVAFNSLHAMNLARDFSNIQLVSEGDYVQAAAAYTRSLK